MTSSHSINDLQRLKFLQALMRSNLSLAGWEQSFVVCFRRSSRPSLWFTRRRRVVTDQMHRKYGREVGLPLLA